MQKKDKQEKCCSPMRESWDRLMKRPAGVISLAIIVIILLVAILAGVIVPYEDAIRQVAGQKYLPPSPEHLFGCDNYGRDLFARIVHGTRIDLAMSLSATTIAVFIGTILACLCAYYGGKVDMIIMRISEVISSIPGMVLALAICAGIGSGMWQLVVAMIAGTLPLHIRMIRSMALSINSIEYIEAAKAQGAGPFRILLKHYVPNIISIVILQYTQCVSVCIVMGSTLSFIGLGVKSPTPEWGMLLSEGMTYMAMCPWMTIAPGIAIVITALAISTFGDCLRDAFDPKLKVNAIRRKKRR